MRQKRFGWGYFLLAVLALSPVNSSHAQSTPDVRLDANNPKVSFPLARDKIKQGENVIVLRVVRIENPAQVDITVTVSLGRCAGDAEGEQVPLGALGLYPKGLSQGRFAFDLDSALKKVVRGQDPGLFCLELLLRPLRASEKLQETQVFISAPEWQKPPRP